MCLQWQWKLSCVSAYTCGCVSHSSLFGIDSICKAAVCHLVRLLPVHHPTLEIEIPSLLILSPAGTLLAQGCSYRGHILSMYYVVLCFLLGFLMCVCVCVTPVFKLDDSQANTIKASHQLTSSLLGKRVTKHHTATDYSKLLNFRAPWN